MVDTFLRSGLKVLSYKNLFIANGTKKLCSVTIAALHISFTKQETLSMVSFKDFDHSYRTPCLMKTF